MLATLRLCLFYSQAAICLGTDLQQKVFPLVICASLLRRICKQAAAKLHRCGTNREIFNGRFFCFTWAQKPVTPRRTMFFSSKMETLIQYFWICILVFTSIFPFSFGLVAALFFGKGHLLSSSPIIKYCSAKPIWMQQGFCTTSFVHHWPMSVTKHFLYWVYSDPDLSQNAPGPERMAQSDSDSPQLSTNNKL